MNETVLQARQVSPRRGLDWVIEGFGLFKLNPLMWIVIIFAYILISMALSLIPTIGGIVFNLLAPVFFSGFMWGCHALENKDDLEIRHLFEGFQHHAAQLVTLGGIYLTGSILSVGVMFIGTDIDAMQTLFSSGSINPEEARALLGESFLLTSLLGLLLFLLLNIAYCYSPMLITFHGLHVFDAMKYSFKACLRNIFPFLIYGLVLMPLLVLAAIPFGLGLLIMIPIMIASLYVSYKDVFAPSMATQEEIIEEE